MKAYIASTGAGARAQAHVWDQPGCSAVFAGATFPYGREQLIDFLGFEPEQYCSRDTAIHMAMKAYYTAWQPGDMAVGIGLSAAVASAQPRRGENRIHAAMMTAGGVYAVTLGLDSEYGKEARRHHGELADDLILDLLANNRTMSETDTARATELFLARGYWDQRDQRSDYPPADHTMFPGAFNPPHEGHYAMTKGLNPVFWVEAQAPNKPTLRLSDMVHRAKMLRGRARYFTSGCQLYTDKARAHPGRDFLVGADAVLRMFDPKWGPTPEEVAKVFEESETTLVICGRTVDGKYVSAEEAAKVVPDSVFIICRSVPRLDISSSAIRASGQR